MKAHIFAEKSNTTAENRDLPAIEYYQGLFGIVVGLHEELSELGEASLHVVSEEFGVIRGDETISAVAEKGPGGSERVVEQTKSELLGAASDADVMVVLLSTEAFERTVGRIWGELVDTANPGSVWCLGAARSSLENLDLDLLEEKGCTVLTYQRVGVASIGTETREKLLEIVKEKSMK